MVMSAAKMPTPVKTSILSWKEIGFGEMPKLLKCEGTLESMRKDDLPAVIYCEKF